MIDSLLFQACLDKFEQQERTLPYGEGQGS
jgi:hypothetical protein